MLTDTHCHIDFSPLCDDVENTIHQAEIHGIGRFVVPGVHPEGWGRISSLSERFQDRIIPAYGIHPQHADAADDDAFALLDRLSASGAAVGEAGLDSMAGVSRQVQTTVFREQIRIAAKKGLPLIIHCRGLFAETLRLLKEERFDCRGVMHAYSGSPEMAREFIKAGMYISFCGTVTYPGAVKAPRTACEVPLESMLAETDSPDLSPYPLRSSPNHPGNLPLVIRRIAQLRGIGTSVLEHSLENNAETLFNLTRT